MNQQDAITHLETTGASIATLTSDMSDKQARWKPVPESWSALEVLNHLCDEESEDFRLRLDLTLHTPERENSLRSTLRDGLLRAPIILAIYAKLWTGFVASADNP